MFNYLRYVLWITDLFFFVFYCVKMQQQMKKSTMENEKQKKGGGVVGKLLQIVTRLFGKLLCLTIFSIEENCKNTHN